MKLVILDQNGHTTVEDPTEEEYKRLARGRLAYTGAKGSFEQVTGFRPDLEKVYLAAPYAGG